MRAMATSFPPLPPGACHWEILGIGIVYAAPECPHVARDFYGKGAEELLDLQQRMDELQTAAMDYFRLSAFDEWDWERFKRDRREWPEVFYENPADFFDDNQVIDC